MKRTIVLLALVLAAGICQPACHKDEAAKNEAVPKLAEPDQWARAEKDQSPAAYDAYLDNYPAGPKAQEAKEALRELWDAKVKDLTPASMENLTAVIETNRGTIRFKFYPRVAPETCKNFIKLAQSRFYDGLTYHRIIDGFMIQGGDPIGNGSGGPGYSVKAEFGDQKHLEGTVAMARSADPNSAGSQFYICLAPQPKLDRKYTVFGQVSSGMDVVHQIGSSRTGPGDRPIEPQIMKKVYIEGL
ncbi:MAG TPA: peptidylprolyl isomerase [bacterium]|nr:peptidylprolyl isomerase [bacterium]